MFERGVVLVEEQLVVVGRPTPVTSRRQAPWKGVLPKSPVLLVEGQEEFRAQLAQVQIPYIRRQVRFFSFSWKSKQITHCTTTDPSSARLKLPNCIPTFSRPVPNERGIVTG
jgi:hypothetical protein